MTQTLNTVTCPVGHTFPYEQLTIRDGLSVCPVCDRTDWAAPRAHWTRRALVYPLVLLLAGVGLYFIETISGIGVGITYSSQNLGGANWLVAGESVVLVALVLVAAGLVRLIMALRSSSWSRAMLSVPLFLIAGGLGLIAVGDLLDLGLNVAFVNASQPGAGWQLTGQIFDALFFTALTAATAWIAVLVRRRDAGSVVPAEAPAVAAPPAPAVSEPPTAAAEPVAAEPVAAEPVAAEPPTAAAESAVAG